MALVSTSTPLFNITLSGTLSTGGPAVTLPVTALSAAVTQGTGIFMTQSGHTQFWVVDVGGAVQGATSIPVVSQTPNFAYTAAATVQTYFNSGSFQIARAVYISGTVNTDQAGTLFVEQSGDGVNWDVSTTLLVAANTGVGFQETLVQTFFRIRYINTGGVNQGVFRIFADARDVYGTFLFNQATPSAGGAYVVLYFNPMQGVYNVVGRFDGVDNYAVNEEAAVFNNISGKYASCLTSLFVATQETVANSSTSTSTSF